MKKQYFTSAASQAHTINNKPDSQFYDKQGEVYSVLLRLLAVPSIKVSILTNKCK